MIDERYYDGLSRSIRKYGEAHRSEFAGHWAAGDCRVVVAFTGSLAEHAEALRKLAPADYVIDVVPAQHSLECLEELADRCEAEVTLADKTATASVGVDVVGNAVILGVPSAGSPEAQRLQAVFGADPVNIVEELVEPAT